MPARNLCIYSYCNVPPNIGFRLILMKVNWKLVNIEPHSDILDSRYF